MMKHPGSRPALLLIDIQKGLDEYPYYGTERNNPSAEETAKGLLDFWRTKGLPIYHIKHNSTNPKSPLAIEKKGNAIKSIVKPQIGEMVIEKNENSAFINTPLEKELLQNNIRNLVIVGLTTDHCISSTVRMGANLGFQCTVISDATACFNKTNKEGETFSADLVHKISLVSLEDEFATIMKAEAFIRMIESKS